MEHLFSAIRLCVVFALVGQSASCRGDASQRRTQSPHRPCPTSSTDVELVSRLRAVYAPIELRLPEEVTPRESTDATQRGEGWTGAEGLTVSYAVHAEAIPTRDSFSGDRHVVNCSEHIGGKAAIIRLLYSEQTTAPGQYVVARWVLDSGETLVLTATHPNRSRRDELLSIVRSVRFLNSTP
jgi:hypothetical protein